MDRNESLAVLKALADETRLELLRFLQKRPGYGEELAAQLKLTASTVSFHLHKLEQAGLVRKTKEQYYSVYSVNEDRLGATVRDFLTHEDPPRAVHDARLDAYRRKVLASFFRNNALVRLPTQKKKRLIVLGHFARKFARGVVYSEKDVTAAITEQYADYCTIRRELVDEGFLERSGREYRRIDTDAGDNGRDKHTNTGKDVTMGSLKDMKQQYKQTPTTAGVYRIMNTANGKFLLGSSLNLHGPWNRHKFALTTVGHSNRALQADWNAYGADAFAFEILATVKEDPDVHPSDALKMLEDEWTKKLDPYGENGYNQHNVVKRIREA